jgi:ankyrin repeat protein
MSLELICVIDVCCNALQSCGWLFSSVQEFSDGSDPGDELPQLHQAVVREDIEAVKQLLEAGADPNKKDFKRSTPLHFAADGDAALAKALLAAGADTEARSADDHTPLMWACRAQQASSTGGLVAAWRSRRGS